MKFGHVTDTKREKHGQPWYTTRCQEMEQPAWVKEMWANIAAEVERREADARAARNA